MAGPAPQYRSANRNGHSLTNAQLPPAGVSSGSGPNDRLVGRHEATAGIGQITNDFVPLGEELQPNRTDAAAQLPTWQCGSYAFERFTLASPLRCPQFGQVCRTLSEPGSGNADSGMPAPHDRQ